MSTLETQHWSKVHLHFPKLQAGFSWSPPKALNPPVKLVRQETFPKSEAYGLFLGLRLATYNFSHYVALHVDGGLRCRRALVM